MSAQHTRRADRRALVDAGTRYHEAKLAYCYLPGGGVLSRLEFDAAKDALVYAAECYVMGRRKASVLYGQQQYAKTQKVGK